MKSRPIAIENALAIIALYDRRGAMSLISNSKDAVNALHDLLVFIEGQSERIDELEDRLDMIEKLSRRPIIRPEFQ